MTSKPWLCNLLLGKCNVFESPSLRRFCRKNEVARNPRDYRQLSNMVATHRLSAHAYEKTQEADDDRDPKQEAEIVLAPGVVYFIHLNVRIEE